MASVNIEGLGTVQVDDAFLSLSPEDQARTVDEIVSTVGVGEHAALSPANVDGALPTVDGVPDDGAPPPGGEDGIIDRLGASLSERGVKFDEIVDAFRNDEQTLPETVAQVVGNVGAGAALDTIGEVVGTTASNAFELLQNAAPDAVGTAVDAFRAVADADIVQGGLEAAAQGIESYQAWAERNPRAARNFDAVANLGLLLAPVKGKPRVAAAPSGRAGRAAESLELRATGQEAKRQSDFIEDLVGPEMTKAQRKARVGRTGEPGLVTAARVEPTAKEAAIAADVGSVTGISPKNSVQRNHRIIGQEVEAQTSGLKSSLKAEPFPISNEAIKAENKALQKRLKESPLLTGDAAKTAKKVGRAAERFIQSNPKTGAGMLAARKQLDAWIKKQQPKVFDPARESAISIAVRETRRSMNELISDAAPGVGVKQSLAKQSNLLTAMDNIASKATSDASSKFTQLRETLNKVAGLKEAVVLGPALVGVTTGVLTGPLVTATLVAGATRVAMTPAAKRAAAVMLRKADKAIKVVKDPAILKKLRADRAAVVELVDSFKEKQQ